MNQIICGLLAVLLIGFCMSLFFLLLQNDSSSPTIRQTTHGPVEGIEGTTVLGQKYYAFRGIPYAAPPITGIDPYSGEKVDRRFKAPEPLEYNWTEPLKVHRFRPMCQVSEVLKGGYTKYKYSEDCLFLNLFVPAGGAEKKTVLVYFHGAGIEGGTVTDICLRPDFFLSKDNVVVHVEYRVQMYGFLNLGFGEYTGNMGLKDQQLGMKWIYENIENFSGKKDEIMIFGGSVGGAFAHAHTLNAESRKYFTRALTSSGTITFYNMPSKNSLEKIHDCLGIDETGDRLADYMKTLDSSILKQCNKTDWLMSVESPNAIRPFITKRPEEIYASSEAPVIDMMFFMASQESIQMNPEILDEVKKPWIGTKKFTLPYKGFNKTTFPKEYNKMAEILLNTYFPNATTFDAIREGNIAFLSDLEIADNMLRMVMLQAGANNNSTDKSRHKNTFFVRYSLHTDVNLLAARTKKNYTGACHSDDLCYYFYCDFFYLRSIYKKHLESKDKVYDQMMRFVQMITNFARFGDPSIEGDTPFKSCKSADEIYCTEISNEPKLSVITNIKEQLHYDTWRALDDIYKNVKFTSNNLT